ncbi:alanine racemase [Pseudosulfitobacter koreensis]|uniref:Alanine racemase n=1 Tax=Pseudosulfitobacter koreensis TaxID=2968472 RepID=A0ABT1Z058_9RHOB|nr:alanine racemase [Pseudosulfitobacter koreense]MCR8826511.1 alanine racemase [Pseudosulfitobacter koreense]
MTTAILTIDTGAIARNWQSLDARTEVETGAVVKANGYGLGAPVVARVLARAGCRSFFVATAEEGATLRAALGHGPVIYVFSGHMDGDTGAIREGRLTPLLNSVDQMLRHVEALPGSPFGLQLNTGMNRLGMQASEWSALRDIAVAQRPALIMSHLACSDDPDHEMNARQLRQFQEMTDGIDAARSLAATGGLLLGEEYHFDLCRPGVGIYGGLPFEGAEAVVTLDAPVIQVRDVAQGAPVGYGNGWTAPHASRIATVSAGYADGLIRAMGSGGAQVYAGDVALPVVGRVSMDLITVDVTALGEDPAHLQLLGPHQSVDDLADAAGTIGYEILTALGHRYARRYTE